MEHKFVSIFVRFGFFKVQKFVKICATKNFNFQFIVIFQISMWGHFTKISISIWGHFSKISIQGHFLKISISIRGHFTKILI